jgi:hypothetical protein
MGRSVVRCETVVMMLTKHAQTKDCERDAER